MPPVAVGVAAATVAATAGAAFIAGSVVATAFVVGIGVAAATQALTNALVPDLGDYNTDPVTDQAFTTQANQPRKIVYGEQVVGAQLVGYERVTIGEKDYHVMVLFLVGHPCESVELYEVEGKTAEEVGAAFSPTYYTGDQTEADAFAVANITDWTTNHIGYDLTYVVAQIEVNQDVFPNGVNEMKFIVKGKKVYDPRKDSTAGGIGAHRPDDATTWEWSNNPELCAYDWLRFHGARTVPHRRIPWDFVAYCANYCEEQANYTDKDGNPQSGQRFAVNGVLNNAIRPGEGLNAIMDTMGAKPYRVGGKIFIKPAMYAGPASITVDVSELHDFPSYRPHRPYRELVNTVRGEYIEPDLKWQMTSAPVVTSAAYKERDRGHLESLLSLKMVTEDHQSQRLQKLTLERSRAGFIASYPLPGIRLDIIPGNNIQFVDAATGINKEFLVETATFNAAQNVTELALIEDAQAIYPDSFEPAEGDLTPNTTLPDATSIAAPTNIIWTPTPNDSWRQGVLTWSHPSPASVINYIVLVTNEEGTPETAITFTPATKEQSLNNLPVGTFTVAISARNRFKTSPGTPKTFNVGVPSTPTGALTVNVLPGRVIIVGPALPHPGATYEWMFAFENVFENAFNGGKNTGLTVTNTPHDGTLYVWYRVVDGDLADPTWLTATIPNLIGLSSDEVRPEVIAGITLPTFPKTIFDTFTGLQNAVNFTNNAIDDNEEALEALLATAANALISEDININREIGLRTEILRTNETFELVQTSIEQKADSITLEAVRVNLQSQIDGAVFGDQTAYVDAKLGDLEGRVEETELQLTPSALTTTVQTIVLDQELATQSFVQQQISDLGISNYVTKTSFDAEKVRIDAAEETLNSSLFKRTISSFSIADDAEETLGERLIEAHARLLLAEDERLKLEGAFAFAKEEIKTNSDELSAEVVKTTQQFAQYDGEFASTYQQITAVSTAQGTTAQELSQFKVQAASDIETAKGEAIAEAEDVITATVGYCLLDNAITTHTDRAACEAAGGTWQKLPLAEAFEKMTVSFTDSNGDEVAGSALSLFQAIVNDQNQLFARAFVGTDVDGKLTGIYIQDESGNPVLGTIQLVSSVTEFLRQNGTKFITFDATGNIATLDGQLKLSDGTVIGSVEDIRAQDGADGDTIYTEEQYSVDGSTLWHWPMATGDVYRRERIVTNGVGGPWSAGARIKGDTGPQGVPGAPGSDGVTTYTWIKYADDAAGNGISNDPTGKAYIGFAYNKTTATESNTAADYAWSKVEGDKGDTGVPGAPGNDGQTTYTWIKYSANADGTGLTDLPQSNTVYIGIAVNKTTATESTNKADYVWSKWKGDTGATGATGATGPQGPAGNDGHPGAAFHRLVLRGGVFPSSTTATADFISAFGRSPVLDDVLTYVNSDDSVASTKRYSGSAWITPGAMFPGDVIVKGTLAGDRFTAGTEITSPIIRSGLLKSSAIQYGSAVVLTSYGYLCPVSIDDFAHSYSGMLLDRTVVLPQLIGPAKDTGDANGFDDSRVCFYKTDILIDILATTRCESPASCTIYVDVYYEMTDTNHVAHQVWETVKTTVINAAQSYDWGTAALLYRYTSRDEAWDTLKVRIRGVGTSTNGKPLSLRGRYTIKNNIESANTAHAITSDNNDAPSNPPPSLPPGGGYEP